MGYLKVLTDKVANFFEERFSEMDSVEHFSLKPLREDFYKILRELIEYDSEAEKYNNFRFVVRLDKRIAVIISKKHLKRRARSCLRQLEDKDPTIYNECYSNWKDYLMR